LKKGREYPRKVCAGKRHEIRKGRRSGRSLGKEGLPAEKRVKKKKTMHQCRRASPRTLEGDDLTRKEVFRAKK